jgi:uncharacterized membrane protein
MMNWSGFCHAFGRSGFGHMWGLGAGGGIVGVLGAFLGMLLVAAVLALLVVTTIGLLRPAKAQGTAGPGEFELVRRRLAAGDITLDEYHRIREELDS